MAIQNADFIYYIPFHSIQFWKLLQQKLCAVHAAASDSTVSQQKVLLKDTFMLFRESRLTIDDSTTKACRYVCHLSVELFHLIWMGIVTEAMNAMRSLIWCCGLSHFYFYSYVKCTTNMRRTQSLRYSYYAIIYTSIQGVCAFYFGCNVIRVKCITFCERDVSLFEERNPCIASVCVLMKPG